MLRKTGLNRLKNIPNFTDNEIWIVESTLKERYGPDSPVALEQAESEIRLHSSDRELSICPVLFWKHNTCSFLIIKTADKTYRCQFFYRVHQQYGTGIPEYNDITECVVTLLQAQADHERQNKQASETE